MWLRAQGWPVAETLLAAGLPAAPSAAPTRLVSLHAFFHLIDSLGEREGPDFGVRIATPEALLHLGAPARAIQASRTVREGLTKAATTFHQHSSHVFFQTSATSGGMEVAASIPISGTAEMHHQAQQHVAGFVSSLGLLAMGRPLPAAIRIAPHPIHGVAHLKPHLGEDVTAGPGRQLRMRIPDAYLDLAFPWEPLSLPCDEADSLESIQCGSMGDSARTLISGMIEDGNPSMDRLALCAGRSRRTLQRLLAAEGTSFAALLDSVRHDHALSHLNDGRDSVSSIAQEVGFRSVSSLSRAVRRWTNASPRQIRKDRRTA
jgi:AraC-like DNA-binding protein